MKICLYDQYWGTLGGGEKYLGEMAVALAVDHQVELLCPDPTFSLEKLTSTLGIDITNLELKFLDTADPYYIELLSSSYDVFINGTYNSSIRSRAKLSVLVVFFPQILTRSTVLPRPLYYITGESSHYGGNLGQLVGSQWNIRLQCIPSFANEVAIEFLETPKDIVLSDELGYVPYKVTGNRLIAKLRKGHSGTVGIHVTTNTEVPLKDAYVGRRGIWIRCNAQDPQLVHSTYDYLITISDYSMEYVTRRWSRSQDTLILLPPVNQYRCAEKKRQIVSVGRFFKGDHSKKHDILIKAFRRLHAILPDVTLHLVGGLSENLDHATYAGKLMEMARGLPVEFHFNADREMLERLYAESLVYWHATGHGEPLKRHPDRAEHFGITPLEAMSAGCIPIVFKAGGMASYISHGVNGYVWSSVDEIVQITARLFSDIHCEDVSTAAQDYATRYDVQIFHSNVRNALYDMVKGGLMSLDA